MSGNELLDVSKNMRDTRAGYILQGQGNYNNNVQANAGALQNLGQLAGAQFNPGNAAGAFSQGAQGILPMINQGLTNIGAGATTGGAGGGPSLTDLFNTWQRSQGGGLNQPVNTAPSTTWGTEGSGQEPQHNATWGEWAS